MVNRRLDVLRIVDLGGRGDDIAVLAFLALHPTAMPKNTSF